MEHSRKLCLLAFILATNNVVALLSTTNDENNNTNNNNKVINKRHTPFLPGDYWKDKRPEFGDTQTDIEVMVNGTARLKCPITHVADSSISFIRRRDFHILTNGHNVYTTDKRVEILHAAKSHDWYLVISKANHNDSGIYECQISTTSGFHSLVFHLEVVTPRARVEGHDGEFHVVRGSTISLTCIVDEAPTPPQYVFWYHEERMVNYDLSSMSSVSVKTSEESGIIRSMLTITDAVPKDAGNYTCKPSNAIAASIQVFVSEDRKSEPLLRPDAKDHSQADKKDKLSAKSKSSAVDSFLQQSTAAIGEGCRQQQSLTTHNKILLLILFLLVHWVLNIV